MSRRKVFVTAMAVTLAVILCAGGMILLHRNTKEPKEYTGGTTEINFEEADTHTAGDAVLVPVPKAETEAVPVSDGESHTDETTNRESAGVSADDETGSADRSVIVLNEQPENVWEEESAPVSGYTARTQLPAADSIGTLKIPSIGLTVNAYDSANTMEDMDKGISHFQSTSYWDGNVCFAGHNGNRAYSFFGKLHNVKVGDTITYETQLGTRTYIVSNIWTISDDDWSHLERTEDNRLTLITCVSDPAKRLCVQAVEQ